MFKRGILWAVPLSPIAVPHHQHPVVPHQHCTLWYDCCFDEVKHWIGCVFTAEIQGWASDDRIQAATVNVPPGIFRHEIPHITLSLKEDVAPVESTQMLKDAAEIKAVSIEMQWEIEFFEFPT
jgi:Fungal tRNA ligase phosphodiesterase domain